MLKETFILLTILVSIFFQFGICYSAFQDAFIIKEYKLRLRHNATNLDSELNHAKIARQLVHKANWAPLGTISVNNAIKGYPMVNVISINDNDKSGESTGNIQFLLTDLDYTGPDWQHKNKVTMLFSDELELKCSREGIDPMEPTCPRAIISGQIVKMNENDKNYDAAVAAFVQRHPAAKNWLKAHTFYLCTLDIQNIFVLDYYGGPHIVSAADYYNATL